MKFQDRKRAQTIFSLNVVSAITDEMDGLLYQAWDKDMRNKLEVYREWVDNSKGDITII